MSRRRSPSEHVLIAGDERDLPAIAHVLWLLPEDTYGQVFIETLSDDGHEPLPTPERVAVTWLARSRRESSSPLLAFADRGEALAQAIAGWAAEWLPDTDARMAERHLLWIGADENRRVAAACELLLRSRCDHVYPLGDAAGSAPAQIASQPGGAGLTSGE